MSILSDWLDINKMNPAFQVGELCRIFSLTAASANGIISFTGGDGSPLANYVVGKLFNFNLEEIQTKGVTTTLDLPKVAMPVVATKEVQVAEPLVVTKPVDEKVDEQR